MAGPTRISELADQDIEAEDQIPFARGSGSSGLTFKARAKDFVNKLFKVQNSSTVALSLDPLTLTLRADATSTFAQATALNVQNSSTVDFNWNSSTRTLSANTTQMVATSSSPMVAKAWVNIQLGSVVAGYNILSINNPLAGQYEINFPSGLFSDGNYIAIGTCSIEGNIEDPVTIQLGTFTSSTATISTCKSDSGFQNVSRLHLCFFSL